MGRFQIIGLVGIGLAAIGALLAVVLPQLTPPVLTPLAVSWALFVVGGLLFCVGVVGGIVEVLRDSRRRPLRPVSGSPPR